MTNDKSFELVNQLDFLVQLLPTLLYAIKLLGEMKLSNAERNMPNVFLVKVR